MITAATRVVAVIGDPIDHSLSPAIHNAAFEALGLDWTFVALKVRGPDLAPAVAGVRATGIAGLSVTLPHKTAIVPLLDRLSPTAETLSAVNCVSRDDGTLVGHNTDGAGLVDALAEVGFDPRGKECLVLGAGGAGRAGVHALAAAGAAEVGVWARRADAAHAAAVLAGPAGRAVEADPRGYDLVVNATSLGMAEGDASPLPAESISAGQHVVDLAYARGTTQLLGYAREAGALTLDGTGPLLHQAARAFRLWTGGEPPLAVMRSAVRLPKDEATMGR